MSKSAKGDARITALAAPSQSGSGDTTKDDDREDRTQGSPQVLNKGSSEAGDSSTRSRDLRSAHPLSDQGLSLLSEPQHAKVSFRFGRRVHLKVQADLTSGGLLSIAALVSGILLSTAVLVHIAVRDGKSDGM